MQISYNWAGKQLIRLVAYLGNISNKDAGSDREDWEGKNCVNDPDPCIEIKGDIPKDQTTEIQHQREVSPPV